MKFSSSAMLSLVSVLALVLPFEGAKYPPIVPPKFVFRADFRSPTKIFEEGFKHIGENTNLRDHVHGGSCSYGYNPSSAFVATTSDEAFAEKWGADQLWMDKFKAAPNFWVYKIRATPNFYDCFGSLMAAYRKSSDTAYKHIALWSQHQKEWLAYHGVPPELIESARMFEKDDIPTNGNSIPFDDSAAKPNGVMALLTSHIKSFLGACFGSCPSGGQSDESAELRNDPSGSCSTQQIVFQTNITAQKATVWNPLDNEPSEIIAPWEEETTIYGHVVEKPEDCEVIPGTNEVNHLQIKCARNKFFDSFVVLLKAKLAGHLVVDTHFTHGDTSRTWKKAAHHIPLSNGPGNLAQLRVGINEVFTRPATGNHKGYWSEIKVYPVCPDYIEKFIYSSTLVIVYMW